MVCSRVKHEIGLGDDRLCWYCCELQTVPLTPDVITSVAVGKNRNENLKGLFITRKYRPRELEVLGEAGSEKLTVRG
jgi:hypothetical protein